MFSDIILIGIGIVVGLLSVLVYNFVASKIK